MSRTDSPETEQKPDFSALMPPPPVPMPDEVYERYKGPGELAVSITRASILGTAGWYLGKIFGDWGAHDGAKYKPLKGRTLGGLFATAGTLMGLYSASRESREANQQHHKLQRTVMEIHEENSELRHALHEARVMLHVPEPVAAVADVQPQTLSAKAEESVPDTQIQAADAVVRNLHSAQDKILAQHTHA